MYCLGFRRVQGSRFGFRVQGLGFGVLLGSRVQGLGFGVHCLGFRVQGSGFRGWGPGFRVEGLGFPHSCPKLDSITMTATGENGSKLNSTNC